MNSIKVMVENLCFMMMTMVILWRELNKTNVGRFPLKIAMGKEAVSLKWCTFQALLLFDNDSDDDGEVQGVEYCEYDYNYNGHKSYLVGVSKLLFILNHLLNMFNNFFL